MRIIALALLLAGCAATAPAPAGSTPPPAARGATLATFDQNVRVGGVSVRPIRVVEDSRCPRDVLCVWAVRLRLLARVGGEEMVLTLGEPRALPGGGSILLASASPDRWRSPPPGIDPMPRFGFVRVRSVSD